jgi:hypothetical protein
MPRLAFCQPLRAGHPAKRTLRCTGKPFRSWFHLLGGVTGNRTGKPGRRARCSGGPPDGMSAPGPGQSSAPAMSAVAGSSGSCGGSSGHRRHGPCVPRFGCLAAAAAISRLAPRQARACLCANLWMTCAKARRICAQRAVNGGDSRSAAPFRGAVTCENTIRALCVGRKPKMSTGHTEMVHIYAVRLPYVYRAVIRR